MMMKILHYVQNDSFLFLTSSEHPSSPDLCMIAVCEDTDSGDEDIDSRIRTQKRVSKQISFQKTIKGKGFA
jgi:hypothetical protein